MANSRWIGVDFDWTLWHSRKQEPMPGAIEAMQQLRERGFKIMVHSCNNPGFIRQCCTNYGIPIDAVWGESSLDAGGKPNCEVFIDDRGFYFDGDWASATPRIIDQVLHRASHPKSDG